MDLGLEVKTFREARYKCSSLGGRERVNRIGRDCELEISEILLRVDPGIWVPRHVIIAFMCMVTSHRVRCECTIGTFTTLGEYGVSLSLGLRPMKTQSSKQEMKSN